MFSLPILFFLWRPVGAESTLCHIGTHLCHQLLGRSCTHFILWFHLARLFLYLVIYNRDLSKQVTCVRYLWQFQVSWDRQVSPCCITSWQWWTNIPLPRTCALLSSHSGCPPWCCSILPKSTTLPCRSWNVSKVTKKKHSEHKRREQSLVPCVR